MKWDFGIRMTHTGSRFIDAENTTWMPDYELVDCWLGYSNQLWEQTFSVKAGIDNLFNQAYQIMPYRPLPGRVFQIQINIQIEQK